jgi:hypothetical protein
MANEIVWDGVSTGSTKYFTIQRVTDRQMWSTAGTPGFEALTVANWANYAISMTETPSASYFYVGSWPATLTTVGFYRVNVYKCSATTPDIGDRATRMMGTYRGYWNGTKFEINASDMVQVAGTTQTAGDIFSGVNAIGLTLGTPLTTSIVTDIHAVTLSIPGTKVDLVDAPNATALAAMKTAVGNPQGFKKNVTGTYINIPMFLTGTDSPAIGKTVTVDLAKDANTTAPATNSPVEITKSGVGIGVYRLLLTQTETNYNDVAGVATATGCDPTPFTIHFNA